MANYNKLASLMGEHHELAILRNFQRSNTKNLLYMQAEILHLEKEIQVIEVEDQTSNDETNLNTLQEWLDRPEGGDFFLQGREADMWNCRDDVLTFPWCQAERDLLTGFVSDFVVPWYHTFCHRWLKGSRRENSLGVWHYRYESMKTAVNAISTLLSAILPSTSIFLLYFLSSAVARLAAIMVFTTVFSLVLSTVTKARRPDVFAATTAFAAVQAVFVGGSGLCPSQQQ
ncbi:MAG: hypothetical protein Q9173_000672 [Seirophora scorigena]